MGKGLGSSAGVVALAAFLVHFFHPPSAEQRTPAVTPHVDTDQAKKNDAPAPETSDTVEPDVEGPWLAAQAFSHAESAGRVCLDSADGHCRNMNFANLAQIEGCVAEDTCRSQLKNYFGMGEFRLQFLIATVPDPLHTHLALFTDSAMNAIQQAAFDAHWELAGHWLPWYENAAGESQSAGERRKQRLDGRRQEKQPGLLIFRHSPTDQAFDRNLLFIFLVGETPTAGINGYQFRAARAYERALTNPRDVRVVGPGFSGSFFSLAGLIQEERQRAGHFQYAIRSGTATGARLVAAFEHTTGIKVHGAEQNDTDDAAHLREVLDDLGVDPSQSAILIEDESGFSRDILNSSKSKDGPLRLRFPRDISHLRNVYHDVANSSDAHDKSPANVEFSLRDSTNGEDTLPVFAKEQIAATQNAALNEIIGQICDKKIRLVQIGATNVLDLMFLAGVLRRQCPNARLLIASPDLLFVQELQHEPLIGLLALSSYPLFSASKQWLGEHDVTHINTTGEALYYAVRLSLLNASDRNDFSDYSPDGQTHPSSWLLTLDRHGFSPVALTPNKTAHWFEEVKTSQPAQFNSFDPSASWILITTIVTVFASLFCGWIIHLKLNTRLLSWSILATDSNHIADAHRLTLLVFSLLTLSAALWALILPALQMRSTLYSLLLLLPAMPLLIAGWMCVAVWKKPRRSLQRPVYLVGAVLLFAAFAFAWTVCCFRQNGRTGFFFAFRVLQLQLGSSPVIPILLLLAALFLFAFLHSMRFFLAINSRPRMFSAQIDNYLRGRLRRSRRQLNRILVTPMEISNRGQLAWTALVVVVTVVLGYVFAFPANLASAEGRTFDKILLVLVLTVSWLVVLTVIQLRSGWSALSPLLAELNALPFGRSFTRLREAGSNGPLWAQRLNLQSLGIPRRSATVLHNLSILAKDSSWNYHLYADDIRNDLLRYWLGVSSLIGACMQTSSGQCIPADRQSCRQQFSRVRFLGADLAHTLIEKILLPEWTTRVLPSLAEGTTHSSEPSDAYEYAQLFVALQFSLFINYGVRQLQNLVLAISLGFGLLVLALNVYPLQAPQAINRSLLVAFVILGWIVWKVVSQMERNPILSRMGGTKPGELNREFYLRLLGYGVLPALALISSQFPTIGHFVSSWLQPSLEAIH